MGWAIWPPGLEKLLLWIQRRYQPQGGIFVMENGCGSKDEPLEQALHDADRISYLHDHVDAMRSAMRQGADVRGYFTWTLLDNFEWHDGYDYRFGLVHVDFETQKRTPKDSAHWYSAVAQSNTLVPPESLMMPTFLSGRPDSAAIPRES